MSRSKVCRTAAWLGRASVLASWPLLAAWGCNVYEGSLPGGSAAPLAGSGSSAASGGTAVSGATSTGGSGGATAGSAGATGSGGAPTAGTAGGAGEGGSAGTHTGGSGGSSGKASGDGGEPATGATEIIDDMEDGDAQIDPTLPRNGYWYVGHDLTAGTSEPASGAFMMTDLGASERSLYAARLKAANFTDWGSVIGFNFIEQATIVKPYDGSAFCGIQFWGKAASATTVRFRVPDIDTHQTGGVCTDPGTSGTACYDHFGAPAAFATAWKSFSFQFTDLIQIGTGYHPADGKLKTDKLFAVEWAVPGLNKTYEIWIDDVQFIKCP